jgi:hypothetical protein
MSALSRIALVSAIAVTLGTLAAATHQPAFAQERECFNGTPIACDYTIDWRCEAKLIPVPFPPYYLPTFSCSFERRDSKWWAPKPGSEENDRYVPPGESRKQLPSDVTRDDADSGD